MSRILLVDDNPTYLSYCREELAAKGYEVTTALDGREALSVLETRWPDVAVLDLSMPFVDGISLLQTIRERRPATIVILHSAHTEYAHSFDAWQANAFVAKSTDLDALTETIRRQLALRESEVA
jgi:DNA-binding NtrC family response regulator